MSCANDCVRSGEFQRQFSARFSARRRTLQTVHLLQELHRSTGWYVMPFNFTFTFTFTAMQ